MVKRPERIQVIDELGNPRTLASGEKQFAVFAGKGPVLVFGLGPDPAIPASFLPGKGVFWVEAPEQSAQMPEKWHRAIPPGWEKLPFEAISPDFLKNFQIIQYVPGQRLFPSFWGPLAAALHWSRLPAHPPSLCDEVWIPVEGTDLLTRELTEAFEAEGLKVRRIRQDTASAALPRLLAEARPKLFFSVNGKGLDPLGETFHLLRRAGAEVALWFVDNPFHVLSGLKAPFWREAHLFVTDHWFAGPLEKHGATHVAHLPLAAAQHMFKAPAGRAPEGLRNALAFVGRSEFPAKKRFFSGLKLSAEFKDKSLNQLRKGQRPDFAWWCEATGTTALWPGKEVRIPGFGADESSQAWRTLCLREAAGSLPVVIYGDANWRNLVPEAREFRESVDYYGPLPDIYNEALANLNVTSLLLPAGLTQRHFDVWAAGGLLVTDATPGLCIFPEELAREIRFRHPREIAGIVRKFPPESRERRELIARWRGHIRDAHLYAHRIRTVLDRIF